MKKFTHPERDDTRAASLWYAEAMEQLVEVVQQLSLARDLSSVMEIVRHAARQLTGADGATFVLRDDDKCFYAEEDAISPLWKGQRFPMSACVSGWVMLNKQAAVIEDIYADPRIPADAYRPTFVRSLAMVPIRTMEPVGAIGNYWANQHLPTTEQVKVLQALADITAVTMENVRIYEELEQRVERRTSELQSILDNVQVGIVFAIDGKVVRANPKACEIFGKDSTLPSTPLERLLRNAESDIPLSKTAREHFDRGNVFMSESVILRQDNRKLWCHLVAKSLGPTSPPNSEIWVINDISERKEKERKLNELKIAAEKANHAKDSFLATMSHEIRTPLTGMLGMLELLSLTGLDNEQRTTLDAAWDSGRGLLRIVDDILDWSKIEEGKLELSLRSTSVRQVLQEVVNTYSRVASSKSLLLWQHCDSRLHEAYIVDSLRLSQVLNNFVSNAIKFTNEGEIEVRAELVQRLESGDRVRFSVKDTGIGIGQEAQEQLFQRYRQESADTARMYGGTGLGLAICRRLSEIMDAQIDLKSEQGIGSVFSITFTLPVSGVPYETAPALPAEVRQRDVKPLFADAANAPLVLAVDDHPTNRDLLARQLRLLGLQADTAENGRVALEMWRSKRHALIITDCHMPEMDGYELSREIRDHEQQSQPVQHTSIVAWTANALAEEAGHCREAGMDDLLVKPTGLAQLRKMLLKWLQPTDDQQTSELHSPVDFNVLNRVVEDSGSRLKVLQDFRTHIVADTARLYETLKREDAPSTGNLAHRMKGACRMVGATYLARICSRIEKAGHDGDIEAALAVRSSLEDGIRQMEVFIDSLNERKS